MLSQPDSLISARLNAQFGAAPADTILTAALEEFGGRIAMVSSFGAEAAVLLHMLSTVDRSVPVLMLDTLLLFPETLEYQRDLTSHLGLTDVRRITPDETTDPDRSLHRRDSQACCDLRKKVPLDAALSGFAAVITGRKRFQTRARTDMQSFELDSAGRTKVNPLAFWSAEMIADYMAAHDLPRHPLVARGFPSIGCAPCTSAVGAGEDARAGRWRDEDRDECGIHFSPDGTIQRKTG